MFDKVRIKYLVYLFFLFHSNVRPLTIMTKEKKSKEKKIIWNKNEIFFTADEEQKKKEKFFIMTEIYRQKIYFSYPNESYERKFLF